MPLDDQNDEESSPTLANSNHPSGLSPDQGNSSGDDAVDASLRTAPAGSPSVGMTGFSHNSYNGNHKGGCDDGRKTPSVQQGAIKALGAFFFHSGIPSSCLRYSLLSLAIIGIGIIGMSKFPSLEIYSYPLASILVALGILILFTSSLLIILHGFLVFCHARRIFYNQDFIHYISELEGYIALITALTIILLIHCFSTVQVWSDKWIFHTADLRLLFMKVSLGLLLATILFAIKRHYMTGLAVSFNFSNYRDRIQESLFADHIIHLLQRSRHTYKFRQKMRSKEEQSLQQSIRRSERRQLAPDFGNFVRSRRTERPEQSARSVREIFRQVEERIDTPQGTPSSLESPLPLQPSSASPGGGRNTQTGFPCTASPRTAASLVGPSVATYLTESDKKRQFSEFYRLANQIISRFSNHADYRVDIANEAKRVAGKLYKYLRHEDRDYLLGEDLLPYIEDELEFRKAITLLKRYMEGTWNNPPTLLSVEETTMFAFSQADLQRSIEGILTEVYVTAKSLQSIETALDKVDSFFTFLVLLSMIIVVAIVMGDAVKLLLALSTMLSGAAFAFGTSARNMFESMIFLLIIHPFDVGDRVFIPLGTTMTNLATTFATMSGVDSLDNLLVSEMHLLSTVFERWDGVKLYVPNYILAAKPIFNIRRSGPIIDLQRVHIDFSTPINKIDELRNRLADYVSRESTDFTHFSRVAIDSIENCNRIYLNIVYQHNTNWQDLDMQLARRTKLLCFIKDCLEALEITFLPPIQRVALMPSSRAELPSEASNHSLNLLTAGEVRRLLQVAQASFPV